MENPRQLKAKAFDGREKKPPAQEQWVTMDINARNNG